MKTTLLIFASILSLGLATHAESPTSTSLFSKVTEEQPLCYGKEYSYSHLQKHSNQTVQSIKAKLGLIAKYNQQTLNLELILKNDLAHIYRAAFTCIDAHCYIDCDGGSVNLQKGQNGHLVLKNNGFIAEGGCGEEIKEVFLTAQSGGDDIFNLAPLPKEYCQNTDAPLLDE